MNSNEHNPMEHWLGENISDAPTYATNGKITLLTIEILFSVLIFMVFSYLYDQWYATRSRSHRPTMFFFATTDPSHTASRGLDPVVLKSLPVFSFSGATHKDPIDCAVCLSEFEEGESGRVLPGCKHAFHVECIDMWFHSHSTCPLCRSLVVVEEPHATTTVEEQVTITIAISPEPRSGSSAMPPLDDLGREPAAIETNRRSFSEFEEDDLTRNHSPMNRMLSRKGRSAPSSFAGAPSSSCQVVMNESDIERGGEEIKSDFRHVDVP
ncbi:BnaC01g35170D [Brassica napus]|uniref:RING-type E3 ubiquitin transferase n=1 Tax=Brassica napus TaxID=3708 RepID=A0A078GT86_BRANA|nr:RING-H2 finger protein ATL2 [Brassica napus]CAF2078380.1 unnamed protein product [Brassica napus]CDY28347.1 BnaC01g35170D [Brassica napus]